MAIPVAAITAGLGAIQTLVGLFGRGRRKRQIQRLQSQRKAFETPEEVFQALNAAEFNAQTGLGAETLAYLTGGIDRTFASTVGAATRLGGDPNVLSRAFEQYALQGQRIGSLDQSARMANFGQYLTALNTVAQNRAAEQVSRDNLLKDQIQALSAQGADDTKNIQSGLNATLSGLSAIASANLYNPTETRTGDAVSDFANRNPEQATSAATNVGTGITGLLQRSESLLQGVNQGAQYGSGMQSLMSGAMQPSSPYSNIGQGLSIGAQTINAINLLTNRYGGNFIQ